VAAVAVPKCCHSTSSVVSLTVANVAASIMLHLGCNVLDYNKTECTVAAEAGSQQGQPGRSKHDK
jgi:hypothetical protein